MDLSQGEIIIHASGGTASKGYNTYKVTLPSAQMKALGINEQDREVELLFDGRSIRIAKACDMDEFLSVRQVSSKLLLKLSFYDREHFCTTMLADVSEHMRQVQNHTERIIKTVFGNNLMPTWEDFVFFVEEGCIPHKRAGLRKHVETIGIDEYDPIEIIKKAEGRMAEDDQWIIVEVLPWRSNL